MDRRMASGAPTGATFQELCRRETGMGYVADDDRAGNGLDLCVAFEAEIVVAFGQHLRVD